jgi:uncharacterized protein YfaS (alpha-2-macroglobulin family)
MVAAWSDFRQRRVADSRPVAQAECLVGSDRAEYRPGDTAHYTLRTTDEAGRGVAAEVAVSVVDESLYAVRPDSTPDLYALFWAMRQNFVTTASSAPEELSGGAYQRVNKMASVRRQFLIPRSGTHAYKPMPAAMPFSPSPYQAT